MSIKEHGNSPDVGCESAARSAASATLVRGPELADGAHVLLDDARGSASSSVANGRRPAVVLRLPRQAIRAAAVAVWLASGALLNFPAFSADWKLKPSVSLIELYSDNIRLAPPGEADGALASVLTPGIDIAHEASRFQFDLRYRMQNLFYAGGDAPSNRIQNFLQSNALAEIVKENLYFSTQANVGRVLTSTTGNFTPNAVFATNNVTDFQSIRLAPYWQGRIKSYSDGLAGISYGNTGTGSETTNAGNSLNGLGDSNVLEQFASFQSGTDFHAFTWRANFANSEFSFGSNAQEGLTGSSTRYRNGNAELRYSFLDDYSVFVRGGNFDNKLPQDGQVGGVSNGTYWNVGGGWTPSPKTALQAAWGTEDYFIGAKWQPTRRTTLQVVYRNSQVGGAYGGTGGGYGGGSGGGYASRVYYPLVPSYRLGTPPPPPSAPDPNSAATQGGQTPSQANTGYLDSSVSPYNQLGGFNAGTTWNALLRHAGARSVWCGSYQETAQPYQALLLYQGSLCQPPLLGGVLTSPQQGGVNPLAVNQSPTGGLQGGQFGSFDISQPAVTNQIITRKRGELSIAGTLPKSDMGVYAYQENRSFQPSAQDLWGVAAYWDWRFAPRTTALVRSQWQQIRNKAVSADAGSTNDLLLVSLTLQRNISVNLDGLVGYQYLQQTSNAAANEYFQHGVWAALNLHF